MAARGIASLVVVLGVIVLLASLVSQSGTAAWNNLSSAAEATPSFANPFDERISQNPPLVADGTNPPVGASNADGVPNCDATDHVPYFGCLTTQDGEGSYVWDTTVDGQFSVREDSMPTTSSLPVLGLTILVECRATTGGQFQIALTNSTGVAGIHYQSDTVRCTSSSFTEVSLTTSFVSVRPTVADFSGGLVIFVGVPPFGIEVSYIRVSYIIGMEPECTSGDTLAYVGCLFSNFIGGVIRFFRLIVNAFVFIAQGFVYFGSIVIAFAGLFAVLFTLGAPSPFQEIIDVAVIAMLLFLVIAVIQIVRGSEG